MKLSEIDIDRDNGHTLLAYACKTFLISISELQTRKNDFSFQQHGQNTLLYKRAHFKTCLLPC